MPLDAPLDARCGYSFRPISQCKTRFNLVWLNLVLRALSEGSLKWNSLLLDIYRSCGKVIFLHLSVSHSVHGGGGCIPACTGQTPLLGVQPHSLGRHPPGRHPPGRHLPLADTPRQTPPGRHIPLGRHPLVRHNAPWADTPLDRHPQAGTPPGQTPPCWQLLQQVVRTLLECILVMTCFRIQHSTLKMSS